jgi:hypothetical protein
LTPPPPPEIRGGRERVKKKKIVLQSFGRRSWKEAAAGETKSLSQQSCEKHLRKWVTRR